jgi:hypothetical protein
MNLYMFRAVLLPGIMSPLTVHLAQVYVIRSEDSFRAGPAWSCSEAVFKLLDYPLSKLQYGVPPFVGYHLCLLTQHIYR